MRILVCGGRDYSDWQRLKGVLDSYKSYDMIVIYGDSSGADSLADRWTQENGVKKMRFTAKWDNTDDPRAVVKIDGFGRPYNAAAGPQRNQRMLVEGKPNLAIAFPGGKGTADMVRRAEKAGIPVRRID